MRERHRMRVAPICLALGLGWSLGLGLGGCAVRPGPSAASAMPTPAAPLTPERSEALVGVIVALRRVPARTLGMDPTAFREDGAAPPAGPETDYTEIVIRARDGRTRVMVQPLEAGLAPGRRVRLVHAAQLAVLMPDAR